jgi:hypothetical protein
VHGNNNLFESHRECANIIYGQDTELLKDKENGTYSNDCS